MTVELDVPGPGVRSELTRRGFVAGGLASGLVLLGCGDDEPATNGASRRPSGPITVEHTFGATTVPAQPRRIAVVGLTEQDTLLALGFRPIATTEWYGEQPYAVWPWAREALGAAKPTVLSAADGFQFERIATLRPDLIIGTNSGMERDDYRNLSRIAPTIASARGSTKYFSPWDAQTVLIARAVGREREGRALVRRVKDGYAKVAADHPEFRGKTVTFCQNGFYNGLLYVYPAGLNTQFLTYLGFEINPKLAPLVRRKGQQVTVSAERLKVIDADVVVFATEKPEDIDKLEKVPTFKRVPAIAENRAVYTDDVLSGAIYFISPLSLPYVLERLTPHLEAAIEGRSPRRLVNG